MMKLRVIAEGKIRSSPIKDLAGDYASRIKHYFPFERREAKGEMAAFKMIEKNDFFVLCDEKGEQKSSLELAGFLANCQQRRIKRLVFYIGGPVGIGPKFKERANHVLALSRMTFPHEMAQSILLEQIYRACTILKGEAYHK
jgi:23S rRNA (pseudouridine1915-N3)-methyltransferase